MFTTEEILQMFASRMKDSMVAGPAHVAMFLSFVQLYQHQHAHPIKIYRRTVMDACKIKGKTTFYKVLSELKAIGLIDYEASKNPMQGTLIYFRVKKDKI